MIVVNDIFGGSSVEFRPSFQAEREISNNFKQESPRFALSDNVFRLEHAAFATVNEASQA